MVALAHEARKTVHKGLTIGGRWAVSPRTGFALKRGRGGKIHIEPLESRTLLSATLYVTAPGGVSDATHFGTLQAALLVAMPGDTILLQPGFAMGAFASGTLVGSVAAGATTLRATAAMEVGQVVSIGNTFGTDPLERALVTGVTATGEGDFWLTLATPLLFAHTGSAINGMNSGTTGATIGIGKALTISGDPAAGAPVALPFNLEIWRGVSGVTLSNLSLTVSPATSIYVNGDGNTLLNVNVSNQVMLTNADNNTLVNVTTGSRLYVDTGSSGNVFRDSTFRSVQLRSGTHHNMFVRNAIAGLRATGGGDLNGNDVFEQNTFTGAVAIIGNTATATSSRFVNNTFTIASGSALTLDRASGTSLTGNVFTVGGSFATAITVHNSDDLLIVHNQITMTGPQGMGLFIYADGSGSSSADIHGNTVSTNDGWGIYLGKYDASAALEVRVQGNDLRATAIGVTAWGDGVSAGNVDLGGGSTRFGTSAGGNDFSTFTVGDAMHYAIGQFSTSASHVLKADNNVWSIADPLTVVADSLHTVDAAGSGVITAQLPAPTEPQPVEELGVVVVSLSAVQTATTAGIVAHFTSTFEHVAGDFTVVITWEDGSTSEGIVVANSAGGFDVLASHTWKSGGSFAFVVRVSSSSGVSAEAQGSANITPRTVKAQGKSFSIDKKSVFEGVVATFTDNLRGTAAGAYVASVAWSDGATTAGLVVRNADGTFSVRTTRAFSSMGVILATVSVATLDGVFFATTSLTATVTNKNDKVPGPKPKELKKLAVLVKYTLEQSKKKGAVEKGSHGKGRCLK